jgi:rubrerythrin
MSDTKLRSFCCVDGVLDFAIREEEEAYEFYRSWEKKLTNTATKMVFADLAKEELRHKAQLQEVKKGKTFAPSAKQIEDLKIVDYLNDPAADAAMDYQSALTVAMKKEKDAFKLYSDLAAMSKEVNLKNLFAALAQEEAKHKLKLELIYDEDVLKEN